MRRIPGLALALIVVLPAAAAEPEGHFAAFAAAKHPILTVVDIVRPPKKGPTIWNGFPAKPGVRMSAVRAKSVVDLLADRGSWTYFRRLDAGLPQAFADCQLADFGLEIENGGKKDSFVFSSRCRQLTRIVAGKPAPSFADELEEEVVAVLVVHVAETLPGLDESDERVRRPLRGF